MHHAAVAENESEANGGELYEEDSNDEGECGGLLTEQELVAIYDNLDDDFVDEILGKGFTGAMVEKGGKLRMVAVQRTSTGGWVKANTTAPEVRKLLPPRLGCRIERHRCKTEGQQTWQVRFGKILGYVRVGGYVYTLFSHFLNTALRTSSPPTIFCMSVDIAKVWYPPLDPDSDEEPRSHTATGPDALNDVMTWAWNKHNKWLAG